MSFYDVLGLQQNASLEEIRLAFKQRALEVHPDKGGTTEAFHRVYQAFETLVERFFATDRSGTPKGVVEVIQWK